jgi:ABC-type glycerol-3-phosphate transport system permease component
MTGRFPNRRKTLRLVIIYSLLVILSAFALPPLVISFLTSFKTVSDVYEIPPKLIPTPFTLQNYTQVLVDKNFTLNLYNSAIVAIAVTILTLIAALPSGYGLARFNFRGRKFIALFVLLVYLVPGVALLVPYFVIFKHIGILGTYVAIVIPHLLATIPFAIWFMRGYLTYIPIELEEAAMIDGCSRVGAILRVIFPLLKPAVLAIGLFSFITSWQEFVFALVFSGTKTKTAPVFMASFIEEVSVDWGGLAASTMVFSAPVAALFLLFQRYLVSGLTGGAVKN